MLDAGGAVGVIFGAAGLTLVAFGIGMIVFMARRLSEQKRTLREGFVAEARCLETHVVNNGASNGGGHSRRRLIIGFRAYDGRDVRAVVPSSRPYVAGDIVPVRYPAQRPERAIPVGETSGLGLATCLVSGASVLFICIGLVFAALGFGMAAFANG